MITAIPVPSEPKPVPNRWVWVSNEVYADGSPCGRPSTKPKACDTHERGYDMLPGTQYLLPGNALAEALAELERASVEIEACDLTNWRSVIRRFREARRKVRDLLGEGRGK